MAPSEPEGDPGSGQGKLFVELGVVTNTQYRLGLETWNKGLNLSPENIDASNQVQTSMPPARANQQPPMHQLAVLCIWMGCVFSFGVRWGSSQFISFRC
jgi:hypothetical protein